MLLVATGHPSAQAPPRGNLASDDDEQDYLGAEGEDDHDDHENDDDPGVVSSVALSRPGHTLLSLTHFPFPYSPLAALHLIPSQTSLPPLLSPSPQPAPD